MSISSILLYVLYSLLSPAFSLRLSHTPPAKMAMTSARLCRGLSSSTSKVSPVSWRGRKWGWKKMSSERYELRWEGRESLRTLSAMTASTMPTAFSRYLRSDTARDSTLKSDRSEAMANLMRGSGGGELCGRKGRSARGGKRERSCAELTCLMCIQ